MTCRRLGRRPDARATVGYLYTHFDCPKCDEPCEVEGDAGHDTVECDACGTPVLIREVL